MLAAKTQGLDGNTIIEIPPDFIANEWSSGKVHPGKDLTVVTAFETPVTLDELLTYQWIWTFKTHNNTIIVCTFNVDTDSCLSTNDAPKPSGDRPDVRGVLLTINGVLVEPDQVAVPIQSGYIMVHPMTDPDGSYSRSTLVTLGYYPNVSGTQGTWTGVDTIAGSIAEITMDRDKQVTVASGP